MKWCKVSQAVSQIIVAGAVLYGAYVVNKYMESWTTSFMQGSRDLHEMTRSVENINLEMQKLQSQIYYMNGNVNSMRKNTTPGGMFRSVMPF